MQVICILFHNTDIDLSIFARDFSRLTNVGFALIVLPYENGLMIFMVVSHLYEIVCAVALLQDCSMVVLQFKWSKR